MHKKDITARNYWLDLLEGYVTLVKIPSDYITGEITNSRSREILEVDGFLREQIYDYLSRNEIELEFLIDGVYSFIIQKYSGENDVVIGKTVDGFPLRCKVKPEEKFIDYIKRLSEQWKRSKEYTYFYMPSIIKRTSLKKMLINTVIAWKEHNEDKLFFPNIDKYNYYLCVSDSENLEIEFNYRTNIYSVSTAKRVLKFFKFILSQAVGNDEIRIKDFELVEESDKELIINIFNDNYYEFDHNESYVDLFRKAAKKFPTNVCVGDSSRNMNYKETDEFTDSFAVHLYNEGVRPGDTVAIMMDRTIYVPLALISVLKSGATFMPIDKTNPKQRIEYLMEDSDAKFILSCKSLYHTVREYEDKKIILIDEDKTIENLEKLDVSNIRKIKINPMSTAYKISTSGSTGRPKCMGITHLGFMNMCHYTVDYIDADENDVCGVYLSFSFDAAIKQILPYLLVGASVNVIAGRFKTDENILNGYVEDMGITILALPSIFAKLFILNCENSKLRVLQAGGDRLKVYKKRSYRIINEYGPAEFTVLATSFEVEKHYEVIPVGKTIYNTKAYIVDDFGKLCPVGVPGELCLSGIQISTGYINREDLNKKVFVDNPFSSEKGYEKMYRTGDLCMWLDSGDIDMIGRMDSQVKIDGIRIDLYEIEYLINALGDIKSSACILREDDKKQYIEAFIVPYDEDFQVEKLTKYLKKRLPKYMIPRFITKICAIPVTPIGKVDKKALPYAEEL